MTCLTSLFKLWIWLVLPLYSSCGYVLSYLLFTLLIWRVLPLYSGCGLNIYKTKHITQSTSSFRLWIWLVLPLNCGYDLSYHFIQVVDMTCLTTLFRLCIWLVLPPYSGCGYYMVCLTSLFRLWIWSAVSTSSIAFLRFSSFLWHLERYTRDLTSSGDRRRAYKGGNNSSHKEVVN